MRVVGETSALADVEMVEQEERGEITESHCSNGPPDDGTSALLRFDSENAFHDGSGDAGHV